MQRVNQFVPYKRIPALSDINQKSAIGSFMFVLLFAMYSIAYNNNFRANALVWYGVAVATIFFLMCQVIMKQTITINPMLMWSLLVYAYFALSLTWAIDKSFHNPMKSMMLIFAMCIMLSLVVKTKEDLEKLLLANYLALIFCAVYIFTVVDPTQLGEVRISSNMEEAWNSNTMSVTMCMGLIFSMYYITKSSKVWTKLLNLAIFALFSIVIFYCGSRSGALMMIGAVVLHMLVKARGAKKVYAIIGATAFLVGFYFLVMYYEPFYNVLGVRFEEMLNGLFGTGKSDGSFDIRADMIAKGWEWFKESPIWGYGIDNFRVLYGDATGLYTYSHNTFIEILVSGGMIGFFIYYSIYVYVFVKLYKSAFKEKDMLAIFLFVMNFIRLISQYSCITYYSTDANHMLLFAIIYIQILGANKNEKSIQSHSTPVSGNILSAF